MNELEVRKVPFMGTELMAARDNDGQIWAGVRWMCDGIGLSRNQRDWHIKKIKEDKVLSKGAENFPLPTNGGPQDVLCLNLDYVPLWLAKIAITPKMERETPDLAAKLEQYQLKAKDVLAAAFLSQAKQLSTPVRFCSFSPKGECRKMAVKGVQPLNNYTCRFRPSSLKCTDKSGLDGLQADK